MVVVHADVGMKFSLLDFLSLMLFSFFNLFQFGICVFFLLASIGLFLLAGFVLLLLFVAISFFFSLLVLFVVFLRDRPSLLVISHPSGGETVLLSAGGVNTNDVQHSIQRFFELGSLGKNNPWC